MLPLFFEEPMTGGLEVTLRAEVLPVPLSLVAKGSLTRGNVGDLLHDLRGAAALHGCPHVTLDLRGLYTIEGPAWDHVRAFLDHQASDSPTLTIKVLPPPQGLPPQSLVDQDTMETAS